MPAHRKHPEAGPPPVPQPPSDLLIPPEAARHLRISVDQLYRLAKSGIIPRIKIGKSLRFRRRTLDAWLERKER